MKSNVNKAYNGSNPAQTIEQWAELISDKMVSDIMDISVETVEAHIEINELASIEG